MREPRGYQSVEPNSNPFGYNSGFYQQRPGYHYDNNSGRYVPAPQNPFRFPGQNYGQQGQWGQQGRAPRVQAPAPRDPYGREYQTPQGFDPGYLWGNRRF